MPLNFVPGCAPWKIDTWLREVYAVDLGFQVTLCFLDGDSPVLVAWFADAERPTQYTYIVQIHIDMLAGKQARQGKPVRPGTPGRQLRSRTLADVDLSTLWRGRAIVRSGQRIEVAAGWEAREVREALSAQRFKPCKQLSPAHPFTWLRLVGP